MEMNSADEGSQVRPFGRLMATEVAPYDSSCESGKAFMSRISGGSPLDIPDMGGIEYSEQY
ncbi:hypothetical protein [Oleiagrimonas sp. C23AA]|uniref:hypothetical protein n=1 Tax=Oleiagrimonas sp. C23AA TaxID=2719047 RepID=UPI0014249628|nr:hypothetical protein [Oleiagrimonas sp. C23AA]NII11792.1 hypothetical protein [Oleiagrimonas sp. C23AA]